MAQLIDKSAVVAEIKRLKEGCYKICAGNLDFLLEAYPEHFYSIEVYNEILSFLDTLEVREVDLKKEVNDYGLYYDGVFFNRKEIIDFARHFFELGLKATLKVR